MRKLDGLVVLPSPRDDILGVLPGDPPLSVLATLGAGGDHILVVVGGNVQYALSVLQVEGVRKFGDDDIGPPPEGQSGGLIAGTISGGDELILVVDACALAERL